MEIKKLAVLKRIANEFNKAEITWALGASMLLYLKEIIEDFHDIDIMVIQEDVKTAQEILSKIGTLQPANPNAKYQTKVFLEYVIDGVDVDVMAGFAIIRDGTVFDCSLKKEEIVEFYELDGEKIPLQSLALWQKYYELMGRDTKVQMIQTFFNQMGK